MQYGYELPAEPPPYYYDIRFVNIPYTMTYPSYCVLLSMPEASNWRDDDLQSVTDDFILVRSAPFPVNDHFHVPDGPGEDAVDLRRAHTFGRSLRR